MASDFFEAKKLNDKSFKDLDDELSAYMAQADNALEALQKGADALVKDLKALPKPRSKIAKPGYVHLLDSFATKVSEDGTNLGARKQKDGRSASLLPDVDGEQRKVLSRHDRRAEKGVSMAITTKKPAEKLTVGAQYICFDTASDGTYSGTYAEDVTCLPTVTQVEVTDTGDDFKDYASGDVYASGTRTMYKQIKTTNLAFEDALIAKMKGDVVDDTSGVIMESGYNRRPYFAYGIYSQKDDGTLDLRDR